MGRGGVDAEAHAERLKAMNEEFNRHIGNVQSWPEPLRDAVRQHGPRRVWDVGLSVLDYPPTWVTEATKAGAVIAALN